MEKFCHFGKILKIFGKSVEGLVSVWQKKFTYFGKIVVLGDVVNAVNSQRLKNNIAVWSHW